MRRPVRIVAWALVFAASAGAGAFVASRTDPFPPGVTDPGERPGPTSAAPSGPPADEPRRWDFSARVESVHELHVGGACRSDWDVQAVLRERVDGLVRGQGLATLRGGAGCDFATADVQAKTVTLRVAGRIGAQDPVRMVLRFEAGEVLDPPGSKDLGGFLVLLADLRLDAGTQGGTSTHARPDGNDGTYRATVHTPRVRCVAAC